MRIVRTGTNQVLTLKFVKNYLKIDPDITIEDDVVQAAIDAAADETDQLLMYTVLMDEFDVIVPFASTGEEVCISYLGPVQRLIDVKVKEWDSSNELVDVVTLTEGTDYTYEIDSKGTLSIELTESGKAQIAKTQYLVANTYAGAYGSEAEVPGSIKKAMLKMIADMVENRVDVDNVKSGDWRASDRQIWLRRQWRF